MKSPGTNAGSGSISRLGPQFAYRPPRMPRPSLPNAPKAQNSNRESLRRVRADDSARRNDEVTAVTLRKQRIPLSSNREVEALFSPAKPLQITIRDDRGGPTSPGLDHQKGEQNSNRESLRPITSNREKGACFSPAMRTERRKTNSRPPTFVAIKKIMSLV
jgi:hypothetical protein